MLERGSFSSDSPGVLEVSGRLILFVLLLIAEKVGDGVVEQPINHCDSRLLLVAKYHLKHLHRGVSPCVGSTFSCSIFFVNISF